MCFFILHFESTLQPKFWHNHELTVMVADICNYPMENERRVVKRALESMPTCFTTVECYHKILLMQDNILADISHIDYFSKGERIFSILNIHQQDNESFIIFL